MQVTSEEEDSSCCGRENASGRETKGSFNRKLQREVRMQKTEEREENMMKIDQSFAALANER